jgi:Tol biopolymer transport system component
MALRAVARPSDPTARRLPVPDWAVVGRPSRDGSFIPYTDVHGDLAVFDAASGTSRTLTQTKGSSEEAGRSAPSPDGSLIAYGWHVLDGGLELRVTRAAGTRPRVLLRPEGVTAIAALDWTPDGTDVIAATEARDGRHTLLRVAADGSGRAVTLKPFGGRVFGVAPDGRSVAFSGYEGEAPAVTHVLRVKPLGGTARTLEQSQRPLRTAFQAWSADGRDVFFTRSTAGEADVALWRVRADGGEPRPTGLVQPHLRAVSVHPHSGRVAFTAGTERYEVWVLEGASPEPR